MYSVTVSKESNSMTVFGYKLSVDAPFIAKYVLGHDDTSWGTMGRYWARGYAIGHDDPSEVRPRAR